MNLHPFSFLFKNFQFPSSSTNLIISCPLSLGKVGLFLFDLSCVYRVSLTFKFLHWQLCMSILYSCVIYR